jgi:hypothetical protein
MHASEGIGMNKSGGLHGAPVSGFRFTHASGRLKIAQNTSTDSPGSSSRVWTLTVSPPLRRSNVALEPGMSRPSINDFTRTCCTRVIAAGAWAPIALNRSVPIATDVGSRSARDAVGKTPAIARRVRQDHRTTDDDPFVSAPIARLRCRDVAVSPGDQHRDLSSTFAVLAAARSERVSHRVLRDLPAEREAGVCGVAIVPAEPHA